MDGLDQVSDDAACFDGPAEETSTPLYEAVRNRFFRSPRPDRRARLARTIEGEVIPRLLLAHRADLRPASGGAEPRALDATSVDRLVSAIATDQGDGGMDLVNGAIAAGASLEEVFLELLAPTARRLGDLWTDDRLTFTEVTLALSRLQRIMRTVSRGGDAAADGPGPAGQILLAAVPGEQHSFGLLMLEEFFRRDGWDVECLVGATRSDILAAVRGRGRLVAVGLSQSVDGDAGGLAGLIADIRAAARSDDLIVMVGGRWINDHPDQVEKVGASFTAVDGRQAIGQIHSILSAGRNGG